MKYVEQKKRLDYIMNLLEINSLELAEASGADHSLITKWRRGERVLSARSSLLLPVAKALLKLDTNNNLQDILQVYRDRCKSDEEAIGMFIASEEMGGHILHNTLPKRRKSGNYEVTHQVFLGKKGLRVATTSFLEYVATLPAGQEVILLFKTDFSWVMEKLTHIFMLLRQTQKIFAMGDTFTLIVCNDKIADQITPFSDVWLAKHLKGEVRSLFYQDYEDHIDKVVAVVGDYCSVRVRVDDEVEDSLYITMHTDIVDVQRDMKECKNYRDSAKELLHYGFFTGNWSGFKKGNGRFIGIMNVPGVAIATQDEYEALGGKRKLPNELFADVGMSSMHAGRLILCREDVRESLAKERRKHEVFSELEGKRLFVRRETAAMQLRRLLRLMEEWEDFEVALVPRLAFNRISLHFAVWEEESLGMWLPDGTKSAYSDHPSISESIYKYGEYIWKRLMVGWRKKTIVARQFKKWIRREDLDMVYKDSKYTQNWGVGPKE